MVHEPRPDRVAFLGLGLMGSLMAACLRRAGFDLAVWTRTPGKAEAWAQAHGAEACATPAAAAAGAAAVVTMVVDGAQVREILLGAEGALAGGGAGVLCVDCSTIGPDAARAIGADVAARGGAFVDAPVTGSTPKATDGTLTIMAGGTDADVARARPLLDAMGATIVHVGPSGDGQAVKVIGNAVATANLAAAAQALVVGKAAGLDVGRLAEVLNAGVAGSAVLTLKSGALIGHDYTTLFKLDHMIKDVALCLEAARDAGVPFPAAAEAQQLLVAAAGRGHGDDDYVSLLEAVEGLAGRRL